MLLTPLESLSRRLLLRPNNLTLVSESVSEFNSKRTTRESLPTSQEMVVCLSLKRTTSASLLDSVDLVTLREIFQESDSRLSKSVDVDFLPFGLERRRSQFTEQTACAETSHKAIKHNA